VTDSHELMMEAELDPDHYRTKTLIKALDKGKKLGLSIGGVVKEAAMEWFGDVGRKVMTYKDIALFHVAITGTPAVADTWVTPITKSVKDWKETPMPKEQTNEQVVEETPIDAPEFNDGEEQPELPEPNAEEQSNAPEPDTTEKSEAEEESDAEVTPDPETPPATPEAPDQKDETPASGESSPAPAEGDTSEVEEEAPEADEVSKKLAASQTEVETLTRSLTEASTKVEELTKSLSDKTTELETVQKSLAEKEAELQKRDARKGIVFDKFAQNTQEVEKSDDEAKAQAEGNKMFATFVITGAKAL